MKKIVLFLICTLTISFVNNTSKIIYIQPLGEVNQQYLNYIKKSVKEFYGYKCIIKPKINFTNSLLTKSKSRYEASKILYKFNSNQNVLIITEKDIAYRRSDDFPEWGIFGLGLRPGKTCLVSTFRLKKNVTKTILLLRLKKVVLHEIGHNLGLEHCTINKKCMMNDANGTVKQVDREIIWFCKKCRKILEKK